MNIQKSLKCNEAKINIVRDASNRFGDGLIYWHQETCFLKMATWINPINPINPRNGKNKGVLKKRCIRTWGMLGSENLSDPLTFKSKFGHALLQRVGPSIIWCQSMPEKTQGPTTGLVSVHGVELRPEGSPVAKDYGQMAIFSASFGYWFCLARVLNLHSSRYFQLLPMTVAHDFKVLKMSDAVGIP